jgi:hypothetical protein
MDQQDASCEAGDHAIPVYLTLFESLMMCSLCFAIEDTPE